MRRTCTCTLLETRLHPTPLPPSHSHSSPRRNKLITKKRKFDSKLIKLHWPQVQQRIDFTVSSLMSKAFHKQAPHYTYIMDMLQVGAGQRLVPRASLVIFADRAFSVNGPQLWNKLPKHIIPGTQHLSTRSSHFWKATCFRQSNLNDLFISSAPQCLGARRFINFKRLIDWLKNHLPIASSGSTETVSVYRYSRNAWYTG